MSLDGEPLEGSEQEVKGPQTRILMNPRVRGQVGWTGRNRRLGSQERDS